MAGLSCILAQDELEAEMSDDRLKQQVLMGLEQADRGELLDFHSEVDTIRFHDQTFFPFGFGDFDLFWDIF